MRIGVLSDTHGFLDEAVFEHFKDCEELWHAGDFGTLEVLQRLQTFKPLRAVYGNIDGADLRSELPAELEWECEGIRVFMTHIGGRPGRYDAKAKKELTRRRPGLFLCGHSHILLVTHDPTLGITYMNPGACGHQGWHNKRTILRITIADGAITNLEAIDLGPRGRKPASNL